MSSPEARPGGSPDSTRPGGGNKETGDVELGKIKEGLESLSPADQRVVKDNLDRAGSYPSDLPLSGSWTLYFSDTSRTKTATEQQYSDAQTELFQADTVPVLCGSLKAYKQAIKNKKGSKSTGDTMGLGTFRAGQNLHFFRSQVNPTWEDDWNCKGGRLTISPSPHTNQLDDVFESLVLLSAGESLENAVEQSLRKANGGEEPRLGMINGVVANRRPRGDRIEIWLGGLQKVEGPPIEWVDELKKTLAEMLRMPELKAIKYKKHF